MSELHPILTGKLASLAASLGTALGAALTFTIRDLKPRTEDALLSGASGTFRKGWLALQLADVAGETPIRGRLKSVRQMHRKKSKKYIHEQIL